jgi:DNA-binding beta-propeller fold protein YncE
MDTTPDWWVSEGGKVVEIDCATMAVTQSWDVGGNTNLMPWPDSGKVLAGAEAFGSDTAGLYVIDTVAGTKTQLVETTDMNVLDVAAVDDKAIVVAVKADSSAYALSCLDLTTGEMSLIEETASYLTSITANNRGQAYVTAGSSWLDPEAPSGLIAYDIATCTAISTEWMGFSMYPTSVAFY